MITVPIVSVPVELTAVSVGKAASSIMTMEECLRVLLIVPKRNFRVYLEFPCKILYYSDLSLSEIRYRLDILESKIPDLKPNDIGS